MRTSQRGFALVMAMGVIMFSAFFAMEMTKESLFEYALSKRSTSDVQAYYAAKAGVQLSLLRIKLYNQTKAQFGEQLRQMGQANMIDLLWQFPIPWPIELPEELSRLDQESIQSNLKESLMEASYTAVITDEGTKIDINALGSPFQQQKEAALLQLRNRLQAAANSDPNFKDKNPRYREDEFLNSIADWVDIDTQSASGGDESGFYRNSNTQEAQLPPNRPFRTVGELKRVYTMNDYLYNLLKDRVTVFGAPYVNVNTAPQEVLMSLSPNMTEEMVDKIMERRQDPTLGPFQSPDVFIQFAAQLGANIIAGDSGLPIVTDQVAHFRITSRGYAKNSSREIIAIVYDFDKIKEGLMAQLEQKAREDAGLPQEEKKNGNSAGSAPTANPGNNNRPPRIVFWQTR